MMQKVQVKKRKIDKLDFIIFKTYFSKTPLRKAIHRLGDVLCTKHIAHKILISKIHKEFLQFNSNTNNLKIEEQSWRHHAH